MAAEIEPIRAEIDAAIRRVLDAGVLVGGSEIDRFEVALASRLRTRFARAVSSGSDALHVILAALGVGAGHEVVTTPLTFFATAGSAARLGARVVFADVDEETLTLAPDAAVAACTTHTRAIVPVHLFGHPAALPAVSVPVVEDAAQSVGGGSLRGIAAAISFFPTKNLGALGDAGAVITDDSELADRVTLLRSHGARPKYHHHVVGGNYRMDAMQAAVLHDKLAHLTRWTAARRTHAERYRAAFAALPDVRLPADHADHVYHHFVIRVPHRDALQAHLAAAGVETAVYYPAPLHLQPCFADLGYRRGACPHAEQACDEVLALPLHPALAPPAQEFVIEQVARFYGAAA
ncbi:MAG: DegT/DnrJ/EryC1/StrS family aminotransferase [Myxococcota bacterium]|nr:DegT/DnrJ/EryC1/StrS family aminotransferase [Myxococcota bacterium]